MTLPVGERPKKSGFLFYYLLRLPTLFANVSFNENTGLHLLNCRIKKYQTPYPTISYSKKF